MSEEPLQNDPRLTAYALGELAFEERAAVEAELARSPESRRIVEEIQQMTHGLAAELSAEPYPMLTHRQRQAIVDALCSERVVAFPVRKYFTAGALTAIAASVMLLVTWDDWFESAHPKSSWIAEWIFERDFSDEARVTPPLRVENRFDRQRLAALLQEGKYLYESDRLNEAKAKLAQAIIEDPSYKTAQDYYNLVMVRMGEQQKAAADMVAQALLAKAPRPWPKPAPTFGLSLPQSFDIAEFPQLASADRNLHVGMFLNLPEREQRGHWPAVKTNLLPTAVFENSRTNGAIGTPLIKTNLLPTSGSEGRGQGERRSDVQGGGRSYGGSVSGEGASGVSPEARSRSGIEEQVPSLRDAPTTSQPLRPSAVESPERGKTNAAAPRLRSRRLDDASSGESFLANVEVAGCPWTGDHRLVCVNLKAREIAQDKRPPCNFAFSFPASACRNAAEVRPRVQQALAHVCRANGPAS